MSHVIDTISLTALPVGLLVEVKYHEEYKAKCRNARYHYLDSQDYVRVLVWESIGRLLNYQNGRGFQLHYSTGNNTGTIGQMCEGGYDWLLEILKTHDSKGTQVLDITGEDP